MKLQSIEGILTGILGALPSAADANDLIQITTSNMYLHMAVDTQDSLPSIQGAETLSNSPEEAVDLMNTTMDQPVKADNIQVSFSVLHDILQSLIHVMTVTVKEHLLKDFDVGTIVAIIVFVAILCFVLYEIFCIYTIHDIILLQ